MTGTTGLISVFLRCAFPGAIYFLPQRIFQSGSWRRGDEPFFTTRI